MAKASNTKPLVQIDDVIREMTDDEYAQYLLVTADSADLPTATK